MQDVDASALYDALKSILLPSEQGRLPADPYKTLIQSLLSSEFSNHMMLPDRHPPAVDNFPDRSDSLIENLVSFGDCGGFGLRHLAKLVSDTAVKRSGSILAALKEALGNLKSEVKTKAIETVFIEVASINGCASEAMTQPLHHRFEVTVEAIVTNLKVGGGPDTGDNDDDAPAEPSQQGATFDECIMAFVRRIMEEAFQAEQSENILCAEIVAVAGNNDQNVQRIDVRNMKERRQQVLSILKAATVGEGEISMEIFLKVKHFLGNFNRDDTGHAGQAETNITEETTGYMRILRKYRFSYCDNNTRFKRCFSRFPFESLARGVFFDGTHALTYRDVYARHLRKMNQTQADRAEQYGNKDKYDSKGNVKPMDDKLFTSVFFLMIKNSRKLMDQGEYVYAAEWMMQLAALMCPLRSNITLIIGRLSQMCSSEVGKLRATRDALVSVRMVSDIVRNRILDYLAKTPDVPLAATGRSRSNTLSVKADKDLVAIKTHFEALTSAILELKLLVLALLRTVNHAEFRYTSTGLENELWQLFTSDRRRPLTDIFQQDEFAAVDSPRGGGAGAALPGSLSIEKLVEMSNTLGTLKSAYDRLGSRLHILECSMGLSLLLNLIRADRSYAESVGELDFKRLDEEREKERQSYFIKGNFDVAEWNKRDVRYAVHAWNEAPRTVWELLGYIQSYYYSRMSLVAEGSSAQAKSVDMKISWYLDLDISNAAVGQFDWTDKQKGRDVDSITKYVLFDPWTPQDGRDGKTFKDKHAGAKNPDGTSRTLGLWDAESILRCTPGEFVLRDMIADEEGRFDSPKFLAAEASRIRYLVETHVMRALHEGLYTAITSKDVGKNGLLPVFSCMSQTMFKFSAYLHMWNDVPSKTIAQYVFAPARVKGGIQYSEDCCGCSVIYMPYRPSPGKLLKSISGGVYGPNRVLTGLGYRAQDIFVRSWMIPPIFGSIPQSPAGVALITLCGLSLNSSLQFGIPNYLVAINERREEAFLRATQDVKDNAGGKRLGKVFKPDTDALSYVKIPRMVGIEYPVTPLEIEVVLKFSCDFIAAESRARKSFGAEVSKCVHFLASSTEWRVSNVAVAMKSGETTCEEDGRPRTSGKLVYRRQQIIEDPEYDNSMQAAAGKSGFVSIECAVALPEPLSEKAKQDKKNEAMQNEPGAGEGADQAAAAAANAESDEIVSLKILTETLERVVNTASIEEDGTYYDPCINDRHRICAGEDKVCSIIQQQIYERGFAKAFVPCRINFTLLTQLPIQIPEKNAPKKYAEDSDDESFASKRDNVGPGGFRRGNKAGRQQQPPQKVGSLSTGNEHLPRLVASTIWLSPQSANSIWTCVQTPGDIEQCYRAEFYRRKAYHDLLRHNNMFAHALEHRKVMTLLSTEYKILAQCVRLNTTLAVSFSKTLDMIRMCSNLLEGGDVATLDVIAFRATMVKYVCLGLRLSLLSPQCVHLRGGCHVLLGNISRLEALLKLVPMPLRITKPVTVMASGISYRLPGQVKTPQESSWDENELRKALGEPEVVQAASQLLRGIEAMCMVLMEAFSRDLDALMVQTTSPQAFSAQAYQMLDTRDVVRSNQEKLQAVFQQTLDAREILSDLSIFDSHGHIKPGNERKKILRETSASSFGTAIDLTDSDALQGLLQRGTTAVGLTGVKSSASLGSGDNEEISDMTYVNQMRQLVQETDGMSCVLADLDNPENRTAWLGREKEFAFTEKGKVLSGQAADALQLAESAADRAKKVAAHQGALKGAARLHGNLVNVDMKTDAVKDTAVQLQEAATAAATAGARPNSATKLRAEVSNVKMVMGLNGPLKTPR